ncbi:MAG: phosphonate C-P lyase system protein PhnH [Janthinobacterium lividum]
MPLAVTAGASVAASQRGSLRGLQPGFADPVGGAQQTFRAALQALSHPGRWFESGAGAAACGVPAGLSPASTALLLALVDADTPLWLPAGVDDAVLRFLRFHCGCPLATDPAAALFLAVPAGFAAPSLADCNAGDPAYPDRSATLLLEVERFESTAPLVLRGPGIEHTQPLAVSGLPPDFPRQWQANQSRWPLGVDVLLICGTAISGLPRTTTLEN